MRLYMKQKVFSFRDRFYIKDEEGRDRYYVEGELLSFGKKLHVYDLAGREVAYIAQKVWSFLPRFFVYVDGAQVAEILKEFSFFKPRYTIDGLNWTVSGNFFAHEYEVSEGGSLVVAISKAWFTWGDSYSIDIYKENQEVYALAVVLAIDAVLASDGAAASANT